MLIAAPNKSQATAASGIYEGVVLHRRMSPRQHEFSYRIFLMYLDLAELSTVFAGSRLWKINRPAIASFRRSDYYGDPAKPIDKGWPGQS